MPQIVSFPDFRLVTPKKMCEDCSEKLAQMCLASEPEASSGHVCHLIDQKGKSEKGYKIYRSKSASSVHISAEAIIIIANSHLQVPELLSSDLRGKLQELLGSHLQAVVERLRDPAARWQQQGFVSTTQCQSWSRSRLGRRMKRSCSNIGPRSTVIAVTPSSHSFSDSSITSFRL